MAVNTTEVSIDHVPMADVPDIRGLRFRRLRGDADYTALAELLTAGSVADDLDYAVDGATLKVDLENETDFDPRRDVLIAEVEGHVVGYGQAGRTIRDDLAVYGVQGTVHPAWRGRGIGTALLRAIERHLRDKAAMFDDAGNRVLGAWLDEKESGAAELLTAEGYTPVRHYFTMIRPDLQSIPDAPLPEGVEIRDVRDEHRRAIFEADNEAFRDHWGHRETTEEDFNRLFSLPDLDTSLWSIAWDGDQVAGGVQAFVWRAENETLGVRRGWLEHISVRRPWRKRGLASALIADALRRLSAAGMTEAMLGVDAENTTGALRLYESLGFRTRNRGMALRKPWEPGGRLV
jgi:mycothiol synthase